MNPTNSDIYFYKGNVLFDLKRKEEAIVCYDKAIQLLPNPIFYANKGIAYKSINRLDKSLECLKEADYIINDTLFKPNLFKIPSEKFNEINNCIKLMVKFTEELIELESIIGKNDKKIKEKSKLKFSLSKYIEEDLKFEDYLEIEEYQKKNIQIEQIINEIQIIKNDLSNEKNNLDNQNKDIYNFNDKNLDEYEKINSYLNNHDQTYLKEYYIGVMKTFSFIYSTSLNLRSGNIKSEDNLQIAYLLSTFASLIPMIEEKISSIITTIDSLISTSQIKKLINDILKSFKNFDDLKNRIAKLLIEVAKNKAIINNLIKTDENIVYNKENSILEKLHEYTTDIKEIIDIKHYSELYISKFEKMGHQDANDLIDITLKNISNNDIDDLLLKEFKKLKLGLKGKNSSEKVKSKKFCNCSCSLF